MRPGALMIMRKRGAKLQISGARAKPFALRNKCLNLVNFIDNDYSKDYLARWLCARFFIGYMLLDSV
jgi:hypothetical protein